MDSEDSSFRQEAIFAFSEVALQRRHGPGGYTNYESYHPWLRDEFIFRCAYCLNRERWYPDEHGFSADHFIPQVQDPTQVSEYDNLNYVCRRCNAYKGKTEGALDPCADALGKHIRVREDGYFDYLTEEGETHIEVLRLNRRDAIEYRQRILHLAKTAVEQGDIQTLLGWFGFPESLPDLKSLRPPGKNSRPDGVQTCFFELRRAGRLPDTY